MTDTAGKTPLVSVLVPVWNREKTIARAIDSIVSSDYQNIELIISDNGSTDNTVAIVESYLRGDDRIILLKSDQNNGAIYNWNRCIEKARGDFIKIVWSDDAIETNTISELIKPLMIDPDSGFSYCNVKLEEENGSVRVMYENPVFPIIGLSQFISGFALRVPHLPVSPGCALIRTPVLKMGWRLKDDFMSDCLDKAIGPDVVLFYAGLITGQHGVYVNSTSVVFYSDPTSITNNSNRGLLNACYDRSVIHLLEKVNSKKHLESFLVLRLLRHYLDPNKNRSLLESSLKTRAKRALLGYRLFYSVIILLSSAFMLLKSKIFR